LLITAGASEPVKSGARLSGERAAQHYAAIIESSDDAIISKDLNGVIMSWNHGAQRLFGYSADEAVGRPVTMLIPADRYDEESAILERIRKGEKVDHYETVRQRKDGSLVDISLTVSPIKNEKGEVFAAAKIARDITENKRAQARQELLLKEMDHRIKNLFAVAISVLGLSGRSAKSAKDVVTTASNRLAALARAHALTLSQGPAGAPQPPKPTRLHALIDAIVAPHDMTEQLGASRFSVVGCDMEISGTTISSLALLLHEFATNSAKYGALSAPSGTIHIRCADDGQSLAVTWIERGGPAVVAPTSAGFGDTLVRSTVAGHLGGEIFHDWKPEGLLIRLVLPRERLTG